MECLESVRNDLKKDVTLLNELQTNLDPYEPSDDKTN